MSSPRKKRLTVTLKKDTAYYLKRLALRDNVPEAKKAAQMIDLGLEALEDEYWAKEAEKIERKTTHWISSEEFWAKVG